MSLWKRLTGKAPGHGKAPQMDARVREMIARDADRILQHTRMVMREEFRLDRGEAFHSPQARDSYFSHISSVPSKIPYGTALSHALATSTMWTNEAAIYEDCKELASAEVVRLISEVFYNKFDNIGSKDDILAYFGLSPRASEEPHRSIDTRVHELQFDAFYGQMHQQVRTIASFQHHNYCIDQGIIVPGVQRAKVPHFSVDSAIDEYANVILDCARPQPKGPYL